MKIILTILALSVAMTACSPAEVDFDTLQDRNGVKYQPNNEVGFTGRAVSFRENGQKKSEVELQGRKARRLRNQVVQER